MEHIKQWLGIIETLESNCWLQWWAIIVWWLEMFLVGNRWFTCPAFSVVWLFSCSEIEWVTVSAGLASPMIYGKNWVIHTKVTSSRKTPRVAKRLKIISNLIGRLGYLRTLTFLSSYFLFTSGDEKFIGCWIESFGHLRKILPKVTQS